MVEVNVNSRRKRQGPQTPLVNKGPTSRLLFRCVCVLYDRLVLHFTFNRKENPEWLDILQKSSEMFLINSASDCQASLDLYSSKSIKTDSDSKLFLTLIILRTACLLACWAFIAFHMAKISTYVSFVDAFFYNLQMAKIGLWIFSGGLLILAIVGGICCCLQVNSKVINKSTQTL